VRTEQEKWAVHDEREIISKPLMGERLMYLYQGSHWGPQAMCDVFLHAYECTEIYTLAKPVSEGCLTCQKINKQALR
jgi:hypothetical protein